MIAKHGNFAILTTYTRYLEIAILACMNTNVTVAEQRGRLAYTVTTQIAVIAEIAQELLGIGIAVTLVRNGIHPR